MTAGRCTLATVRDTAASLTDTTDVACPAFDAVAYEDRNAVERGFSHLKHHRALATRYDKLAVRYRATIYIASIDHWLKRLT